MEHYEILNIKGLFGRFRKKILLKKYYFNKLKQQHCNTKRQSIISEEEYRKYVQIFVEYGLCFKKFPKDHYKFPNMPMARTIRDYFDYEAKVHGFETYKDFVKWKYSEGPWQPSGQIFYCDFKYKK